MDAFNKIVAIPAWAYDFCYYYLAVAVMVVVYSLFALYKLLVLPGVVKKFVPTTTMALALILSGAVTTLLTMLQFWVCRGALAPSRKAEGFAVKCSSDSDCKAVNGVPQGPNCSCGARGLCGGCTVRNDMEPQASFKSNVAYDTVQQPAGYWSMNQAGAAGDLVPYN
jgi:hypothetical protein